MFSQPLASGSKPSVMSNSELIRPRTVRVPRGRRVDAGQQLEQRALAGAVVADDAEPLAFADAAGRCLAGRGRAMTGLAARLNRPRTRNSLSVRCGTAAP